MWVSFPHLYFWTFFLSLFPHSCLTGSVCFCLCLFYSVSFPVCLFVFPFLSLFFNIYFSWLCWVLVGACRIFNLHCNM